MNQPIDGDRGNHGILEDRFPIRMNIAVSRAFGALRVVVPRGELEKDAILMRIIALTGAS